MHIIRQTLEYLPLLQTYLGLTPSPPPNPRYQPDLQMFVFSEHWQVLGPFQIGTREAPWGADPLEQYGGFRALKYDDCASFPSSLPFNATVSWSNATAKSSDPDTASASAELSVRFPDIDWSFLQQVYGWAALQWQGWARGEIVVQSEDTISLALNAVGILEHRIDDHHYFGGDFYGFEKAPAVLHLSPGVHTIDVRLVRDVRSMGGITDDPALDVKLELKASHTDVEQGSEMLIADRVDDDGGLLASELASVVLRNNLQEDIWVASVEPQQSTRHSCETTLVNQGPVKISSGQSRPIAFRISCIPGTANDRIDVAFSYNSKSGKQNKDMAYISGFPRRIQDVHQPQKITYLHPGGMVSYAVLRPPSAKALASCNVTGERLPVLLALHGAGLEADDDMVRHALDALPDLCAWTLFPTGVTAWSGDDWHTWGSADVEAAVQAIKDWIIHTSWTGPGVDVDRWLVAGHSNGGQGTWYILTHHPDKVFASAPLSGYSSIQNYVPYHFWRTADPGKTVIVQAGLSSYRHELLLENARDIPILQQHGTADENVPAYHSRLLHQLLPESGAESTYHELEGKPHYWDGIMTTPPLADFFNRHLDTSGQRGQVDFGHRDFTVVTANPADTGSKNGVQILGLTTPGQLGKIEVEVDAKAEACALTTSNVRLFHLPARLSTCNVLTLDDEHIRLSQVVSSEGITLQREPHGGWAEVNQTQDTGSSSSRRGRQLGSIDSILRTKAAMQIVSHASDKSQGVQDVALQISRNLCQYFSADTEISTDFTNAVSNRTGNVISVYLGTRLHSSEQSIHHAIAVHPDHIKIRDVRGTTHTYRSRKYGLAAIFLRSLPDERLELVVWGADEASLRTAARLVPLVTGTGVPDFVVADSKMLWKGVEGTLAMGFLDENWNVSTNAFFT